MTGVLYRPSAQARPRDEESDLLQRVHPVSFRFTHHAAPSGYDALTRYLGTPIESRPLPGWLVPERLMWRLARGVTMYDRHALALETKAVLHAIRHPGRLYHVIYGEQSYKHLGRMVRPFGGRVVATFHQPPALLEQLVAAREPYADLAAIVVLGRTQIPFFTQMAEGASIRWIPYGVETGYFSPPPADEPRHLGACLMVGNWLRDWDTLRRVIRQVHERRPDITFSAVAVPENLARLADLPVRCLGRISDNDLLALYRTSTLLLQPLTDCVASTSLLEAMACGLPMVASDVGSIRDYVPDEAAMLTPAGDVQAMTEAVLALVEDKGRQRAMSAAGRARAEEFSWPRVVGQLAQLYADTGTGEGGE